MGQSSKVVWLLLEGVPVWRYCWQADWEYSPIGVGEAQESPERVALWVQLKLEAQ